MKSETAKEMLNGRKFSYKVACQAVEVAEHELCDKFTEDIHRLIETWDKSDKKLDAIHVGEIEKLQNEIATLHTALDEANKRCFVAQNVIADKNAEPRCEGDGKMTLNEYQERAMSTCMPSCSNFTYMLTELNAEVGEINDKIAKWRRKGIASIKEDCLVFSTSNLDEAQEYREEVALELGDALWAIAGFANTMGFSLEEIGQMNLDKLAARKQSNTIVTHEDH